MHLIHFDIEAFLRDYWQKKPVIIRNPWQDWANPFDPDELAGLACEDDVEARLISHANGAWNVVHGPLREEHFDEDALGGQPWTLLVQAVDHHVPDVAALIDPFRFIPNWRIDDIMVSYATDQGGVGPHFDQYDVFLIQGLGRRRWQIGAICDDAATLLPHGDLRLLAEFEPIDEWVLEPGDILYVPPRWAHNGTAVGDDCMTYSVGFRAPARSELIAHWSDQVLTDLRDDDRYTDAGTRIQDNPGEISGTDIDRLQAMIITKMSDRESFARWFGAYNSERKYPDIDWSPEQPMTAAELHAGLESGQALCRNPASRFAFVRKDAGGIILFADGESFDCDDGIATIAERICAQESVTIDGEMGRLPVVTELLLTLINQGSLAFEDWDEGA